jgi:hypothetical protein
VATDSRNFGIYFGSSQYLYSSGSNKMDSAEGGNSGSVVLQGSLSVEGGRSEVAGITIKNNKDGSNAKMAIGVSGSYWMIGSAINVAGHGLHLPRDNSNGGHGTNGTISYNNSNTLYITSIATRVGSISNYTQMTNSGNLSTSGTITAAGNITANGNIVGDGSTAISSMASLGVGTVAATGTVIAANPKFFAWKSSDQIILEDADRTIIFDTEIFDVGADYNVSNGIYTAPVDGKYNFSAQIRIDLLDIDANEIRISLVTSDATYRSPFDPNFSGDLTTYSYNINVLADMDANDTAYIAVFVADDRGNSTHVHGYNNVSFIDTFFSGHLVV